MDRLTQRLEVADSASAALEMADDRNLVVQTYNEPLAVALAARLPAHTFLLRRWRTSIGR